MLISSGEQKCLESWVMWPVRGNIWLGLLIELPMARSKIASHFSKVNNNVSMLRFTLYTRPLKWEWNDMSKDGNWWTWAETAPQYDGGHRQEGRRSQSLWWSYLGGPSLLAPSPSTTWKLATRTGSSFSSSCPTPRTEGHHTCGLIYPRFLSMPSMPNQSHTHILLPLAPFPNQPLLFTFLEILQESAKVKKQSKTNI